MACPRWSRRGRWWSPTGGGGRWSNQPQSPWLTLLHWNSSNFLPSFYNSLPLCLFHFTCQSVEMQQATAKGHFLGATLSPSPDFRWRDVFMTSALFLQSFIRISHSDQTTQSVSYPLFLLLTFSGYSRYHMHRTRAVDSVHGVCIELSHRICFGQCALHWLTIMHCP